MVEIPSTTQWVPKKVTKKEIKITLPPHPAPILLSVRLGKHKLPPTQLPASLIKNVTEVSVHGAQVTSNTTAEVDASAWEESQWGT